MSDEGRRDGEDGAGREGGAEGQKAPATVLGAIVSSAVERLQSALQPPPAAEGKAGASAPSTQGVQLWLARVLESMSETRKRRAAEEAAREAAEAEAESSSSSAEGEGEEAGASNVVDLAQVRDAKRAERPSVDLRAAVEASVSQFVAERLAEERGGEVPSEVTIDGAFVAKHGAELLRVVMGSLGQAWLGALTGALPDSMAEAVQSARGGAPQSSSEEDAASEGSSEESSAQDGAAAKPEVRYDVLNIVAGLLKPPPPSSADTPAADEDEERE